MTEKEIEGNESIVTCIKVQLVCVAVQALCVVCVVVYLVMRMVR